ncbi:MAG TPA: sulfatase-like hydrolase/transferase, partial [bacterium]|nr:sulfatase-like hydrolase/transferase [bacterium]
MNSIFHRQKQRSHIIQTHKNSYSASRRQFLRRAGLLLSGLAVAGEAGGSTSQRDQSRPNIVFILTDQHRRDGVGVYGQPGIKTPHLNQIADEGIRFDNAYAAQPVCAPNRASILSGLYPHAHGLLENTWSLSPRIETLAELLSAHDYQCGYFGKWHLGRENSQGFDTFPEYPSDGRGSNHYFDGPGGKRYAVDVITDDALQYLQSNRQRPLYLYVSYYPPHPPYSVPVEFEAMYENTFPNDEHRRIYYAMCSKVDEQVGRILRTLGDLDLAENTLVIFTTEHGHFFEHRWNDHSKRLCYDTAARIPMLMRYPGVIPAGQSTTELISSVDLVQTMLGLLNLEAPPGLQGRDLSQLARGEPGPRREAIYMENYPYIDKGETPGPYNNEPAWGKGVERCVRDQRYKLILSSERPPELYDMHTADQETNNLW